MKKIKLIKCLVNFNSKVRKLFLRSYEDTSLGSIIFSIIISSSIGIALLDLFFSVVPWPLLLLASLIIVVLLGELLGIINKFIFGSKRINVIHLVLQFLLVFTCVDIASQSNHIMSSIIFSLSQTIIISIFGRSLWAVIKHKRKTILLTISTVICIGEIITVGVFLAGEGSSKSYIDDYLAMDQNMIPKADTTKISLEKGTYEVEQITYGLNESNDILSTTYKLTDFVEQNVIEKWNRSIALGYTISDAPIQGKIWLPKEKTSCPVLFIVHGNHTYMDESYLGYDYLGKYLASYGYVTVSIDENICNDLLNENDARAVLVLENMKFLLELNTDETSKIYNLIDPSKIALAGHSRGGEAVSNAYLFNSYSCYPENGNIKFDYNFDISSIIQIAPTVDQYQPAQHCVNLENVNYFIIQGSNDHDVTESMGQKQYYNVTFNDGNHYRKAMLYLSGANHGQFNSIWGSYDLSYPMNFFLNVGNLIEETEQQDVLKIFTKTFLDITLLDDRKNEELLKECRSYKDILPSTIYQQMYQSSDFICLADFEEDSDLNTTSIKDGIIETENLKNWTEEKIVFGISDDSENHVAKIEWEDTKQAQLSLSLQQLNMLGRGLVFDLADASEDNNDILVDGEVIIKDDKGNEAKARISDENIVYPSLPLQLRKLDFVFNNIIYKHPFQTVKISNNLFKEENEKIDLENIIEIKFIFDYSDFGMLYIDNLGLN